MSWCSAATHNRSPSSSSGLLVFDAYGAAVALDRLEVVRQHRRVLPATTAERRGRAVADANPLLVAPVGQVMSTGAIGLGPVRDLVLLVASLGEAVAREHVHLGQVV